MRLHMFSKVRVKIGKLWSKNVQTKKYLLVEIDPRENDRLSKLFLRF